MKFLAGAALGSACICVFIAGMIIGNIGMAFYLGVKNSNG